MINTHVSSAHKSGDTAKVVRENWEILAVALLDGVLVSRNYYFVNILKIVSCVTQDYCDEKDNSLSLHSNANRRILQTSEITQVLRSSQLAVYSTSLFVPFSFLPRQRSHRNHTRHR
jgi:hypothetical protein